MKSSKVISIFVVFTISISFVSAQKTIYFKSGGNYSSFFNYPGVQEDVSNFKAFPGYQISIGVLFPKGKITKLGFEIEHRYIKSAMEVNAYMFHSFTYHNYAYQMNYINSYFILKTSIINRKSFGLNFTFSPFTGMLYHSKATGEGSYPFYTTYTDSSGTEYPYIAYRAGETEKSNCDEISKINIGFRIATQFSFQINEKYYWGIDTSYNIGLQKITDYGWRQTSLMGGSISFLIGLNFP